MSRGVFKVNGMSIPKDDGNGGTFVFFKQKAANGPKSRDWSSDVGPSNLKKKNKNKQTKKKKTTTTKKKPF